MGRDYKEEERARELRRHRKEARRMGRDYNLTRGRGNWGETKGSKKYDARLQWDERARELGRGKKEANRIK